jgi:2-oxoglutarate ferredoxin oxidoreductase subunit gamma
VPATRLAEEIGRRMVLNIVMVGFFGAATGLLPPEPLRRAVADSVPAASVDLNLRAFDRGYEYGLTHPEPAPEETAEWMALERLG